MSARKTRRTPDSGRKRSKKRVASKVAKSTVAPAQPRPDALPLLSLRDFAELVDRSPDTVSRWCAAGMPHEQPGKTNAGFAIDLRKALPWVVTYALEPPKESQRERLAREQADRLALENAHRRGELIDAQLHGEIVKTLASSTSQLLEAVASRCANELAGITDPAAVHARVKEEHRGIRRTMASIVGEFADGLDEAAGSPIVVSTATGPSAGSVGGREAHPAEGFGGAGAVPEQAHAVHDPDHAGGGKPAA